MEHYAEFDIATGRIVRRGKCQSQHIPTPRRLNAIALVRADYEYNAIICDRISNKKMAVNPTLIRRSFDTQKPKPNKILKEKRPAHITNEQWQNVQDRLEALGKLISSKDL